MCLYVRYKLFEKLMRVVNRISHFDPSLIIKLIPVSSMEDSDVCWQLRIIIHIIVHQLLQLTCTYNAPLYVCIYIICMHVHDLYAYSFPVCIFITYIHIQCFIICVHIQFSLYDHYAYSTLYDAM